MEERHKRNFVLHINKFQERILLPVMIACSLACLIMISCLIFMIAQITDSTSVFNFELQRFYMYIPWFLIVLSFIMLLVVFWTYFASNKIVGPYERILRELDAILDGGPKKAIGTRKGDEMFSEILKRINVLIEKLP